MTFKMKSMFFSSIAHELRTPLNTILPMTQKLKSMVRDEKVQKYLTIIYNSSYHLMNVIEDALDMSRIENHKFDIHPENVDMRKVIDEVVQVMDF